MPIFGGSNRTGLTTENTEEHRVIPLCASVLSVVEDFDLSPELHGHARPGGHVGSGERRLLSRYTATYRIKLQTGILRSFDRTTHGLSHERRNLDSALLDVEDDGAARGQLRLGCGHRSIFFLIGLTR